MSKLPHRPQQRANLGRVPARGADAGLVRHRCDRLRLERGDGVTDLTRHLAQPVAVQRALLGPSVAELLAERGTAGQNDRDEHVCSQIGDNHAESTPFSTK